MNLTISNFKEFTQAMPLLKNIQEAGFQAYFVGGSVRDALLGKEVNDVDIATSARPQEIKAIFPRTVDLGIEHGTIMVLEGDESYEVTTFRTETTYQDYRRPDSVSFVRSLEEDLKRRDFTINAFALDIDGEIFDYFDGKKDLEEGIVRAVGDPDERFDEDALRMMRALRFAGQLGFEIESHTLKSISDHRELLQAIAVERVYIEFVKLLKSPSRTTGLRAMVASKLYLYLPAMADKKLALVKLANHEGELSTDSQVWALLMYLIDDYMPTGLNLNNKDFLRQWKASNQVIKESQFLLKGLNYRRQHLELLSKDLLFELGLDLAKDVEHLIGILNPGQEDIPGTEAAYNDLAITDIDQIQMDGHMLMEALNKKPGQWLGDLKQKIKKQIIHGHLANKQDAILAFAKNEIEENN